MKLTVNEAWSLELGGPKARLIVSGASAQATKVTVEVTVPSSGYGMHEEPGSTARIEVSAEEWREMVLAVDGRLAHVIHR